MVRKAVTLPTGGIYYEYIKFGWYSSQNYQLPVIFLASTYLESKRKTNLEKYHNKPFEN